MSCVVDSHPRFYLEALRWYASATDMAGVDPHDLRVKTVGKQRADVADYLRSRGVGVEEIEGFDPRSRHCNKVSGALSLAAERVDGVAVLCDTDLLVFEDPRSIAVPADSVGMKSVDRENPPLAVLEAVFAAAKVPEPPHVDLPLQPGHQTLSGNGNGGLYVIPAGILPAVAGAWGRWASWLLDRPELLGRWALHVDQVAMAVALASEKVGVVDLDARWNAPTHIEELIDARGGSPALLHYHLQVDDFAQVETVGADGVDALVKRANLATAKVWEECFPQATFWNWRYDSRPALGSGATSRGKPLRQKRRMLLRTLHATKPSSVLDVGCGDGEVTRGMHIPGYVGMDVSRAALHRAAGGRRHGTYVLGELLANPVEADLVVCLDVLTCQADAEYYRKLVQSLVRCARSAVLVSGYERAPAAGERSPISFYHEPLSVTLASAGGAELQCLGQRGSEVTLLVVKAPLRRRLGRRTGSNPTLWASEMMASLRQLGARLPLVLARIRKGRRTAAPPATPDRAAA